MSFYKTIENLLLKLDKFQDKEGKLLKSLVIDSAFKIDSDLIELLITNEQAKAKFFKEIAGYWVFNINDFILFIQDKNFLDDSYTRFKNKIGLNIDDKFLNQRKEVALVWPYKDCVLEGNQDKEDTKRQEIFFNEVLAQDEIDRLLDPKVLVNWTRHTANGEVRFSSLRSTHEVGEVDYSTQQTSPRQSSTATPQEGNFFHRDENGTIKENLLIKGNNLLALHTLKKQFRSKIKLIYIDPPYNTGNDGFKYNDRFNHSTWLTFMKNRLEVARELLRDDGVIFVQCDDNEQAYLKVLMDEVFGRENLITNIIIKTAFENGFKTLGNKPVRVKEFVLYYSKDIKNYKYKKVFVENIREWDTHFNLFFDKDKMEVIPLIKKLELEGCLPEGSKLSDINLKNKKIRDFIITNAEFICDTKAINLKKVEEKKGVDLYKLDNKEVFIYKGRMLNSIVSQINKIEGKNTFTLPLSDLWVDIGFNNVQNEGGLNFPNGKKPESLLKRILETSTNPNDIVLDFHAGTGTTGAVAHKMGRQWILVEQMDYIKDLPEARLKKVIGKSEKRKISDEEKISLQEILEKLEKGKNSLI
jgi:adenine-specific DNA-methyltransferase